CPNPRSTARLSVADFETFLREHVSRIGTLQFGCGQEPTADLRLVEFFRALARSSLRPHVRMITNASLLHKHDVAAFRDCGLAMLVVSLDSPRPSVNDRLRPGAEVARVLENLHAFRAACPDVP